MTDISHGWPRREFLQAAAGVAGVAVTSDTLARGVGLGTSAFRRPPRDVNFDSDWKFLRGDAEGAEQDDFDDANWRRIALPHDWSIESIAGSPPAPEDWTAPRELWEAKPRTNNADKLLGVVEVAQRPLPAEVVPGNTGPFNPQRSEGGWATAWTVGGTGWYRKAFSTADLGPTERLEVRFDGAYQETEVWLNGTALGTNSQGYLGFAFDLTPHLRHDRPNVLAVRVRNIGQNSRWYTGSGIYRHVWLTRTGDVHIPLWGVSITTPRVHSSTAEVDVAVEVQNLSPATRDVLVQVAVHDKAGREVAVGSKSLSVTAAGQGQLVVPLAVADPDLWSPDNPALYTANVQLSVAGTTTDGSLTRFGVRTLELSPTQGLLVNGKPFKLKGANLHHDNGLLGAVAIDRAERRKVELMRANGYNAIRCAHNPFSPAFLSACDELGMLVMDELFDSWTIHKVKDDYATRFAENWQRDLTNMVRRDRNHPSVIVWGVGNEILEANSPKGEKIAFEMRHLVMALDKSRPITAALTSATGVGGEQARRHLDVVGYNYETGTYDADHARDQTKFYMGTEQFARNIHDSWREIEARPWLLGEFVWSGMDYLGEVGTGSSRLLPVGTDLPPSRIPFVMYQWDYPAYQSGTGELDLLGQRKPQGRYRDVLWKRSQLELLVRRPAPAGKYEKVGDWAWHDELESWTWPDHIGQLLTVRVYTNGDEVALLLDGTEVARKRVAAGDKLTAEFDLAYKPGTLTAVTYAAGREVARKSLESVGKPAMLKLHAERDRIEGSELDLAYISAEVCDEKGRRVPDASVPLAFSIEGPAKLCAAGSANPRGIENFQDPQTRSFHGFAQLILQPTARRGEVVVRVSSSGLIAATLSFALANIRDVI